MQRCRIYREFEDGTIHFTEQELNDDAMELFKDYRDSEDRRNRDGVKRCWITYPNGDPMLTR